MRFVRGVVNRCTRRPIPPHRVTLLPLCGAAQGQINFLGRVTVPWIVRGRAQDQKAAGELLARQRAAGAEDFAPPVVIEKGGVEILLSICLAPGHRCRGMTDRRHEIGAECGCIAGDVREPTQHGQAAGRHRSKFAGARPLRKEWSKCGMPQGLQQLFDSRCDVRGRSHGLLGRCRSIILAPAFVQIGDYLNRPLVVRCGAFGDMVLLTALIRVLYARFQSPVDIVTSGPWSEPLLRGQPGVGEIFTVRSRKTPYWLSGDQRRVVRCLAVRGAGPTWFCDGSDAARPLLARAGIPEEFVVDVQNYPLLPAEHATEQWRRLAQIMPAALAGTASGHSHDAEVAAMTPGCQLRVSDRQRSDLDAWLQARGLAGAPLVLIQIGNKRTMRRGLRRLAVNNKYWPSERWAEVLRNVRRQCPDHAMVLLGTGPEYALNQEVAALARITRLYNAADDLPIPRLTALLERAAGLITVDSGPAHAAAAVGCPLVVLFGKALPSLYRPWGTAGAEVKVLCGQVAGEPDMLGIDARSVMAAWSGLNLRA